jgi:hypothetical protein
MLYAHIYELNNKYIHEVNYTQCFTRVMNVEQEMTTLGWSVFEENPFETQFWKVVFQVQHKRHGVYAPKDGLALSKSWTK